MSDSIRAAVSAILESAGVYYASYPCGEQNRDGWKCDAWRVNFTHRGGRKALEDFDFFTGLGHRKTVRGSKAMSMRGAEMVKGHWQVTVPQAPHAADVLHSLVMDSSAVGQSFESWCSDFGYDTDSRKALATYEACQQNADKLARVIPRDVLTQISEALQGY